MEALPRLILFDLDDTFYDRASAFRAWVKAFLNARGAHTAANFDLVMQLDEDGYADRLEMFSKLAAALGWATSAEALVDTYRKEFPYFIQPLAPSLQERLESLRRNNCRLGLITNGPSFQESKMDAAGITPLLDGWCISGNERVSKPDPTIFVRAADRCGALLQGAWMVGDNPDTDVAGAVAAGISSIWLRRGRIWPERSFSPTVIADSLLDALDVLTRIAFDDAGDAVAVE